LHSIKRLYGRRLGALDDKIGHVEDCYFDDKNWAVRYFVADTDWWNFPRRVLLSPHAFGPIPEHGTALPVHLTREQIKRSPSLKMEGPVTRDFETDYYSYYDWPFYWQGGWLWGPSDSPTRKQPMTNTAGCQTSTPPGPCAHQPVDANASLRSARAAFGLPVYSGADSVARVADFLMDEKNWRIRYLVLDAGHWYARKEVLISTRKVLSIDWDRSRVEITPTREAIERAEVRPVSHGCIAACHAGVPVS